MAGLGQGPRQGLGLASMPLDLEHFIKPLHVDVAKAHQLAHELHQTFRELAASSLDQFLPTPISESILRPTRGSEKGRYVPLLPCDRGYPITSMLVILTRFIDCYLQTGLEC
jgi:hypothetical protein